MKFWQFVLKGVLNIYTSILTEEIYIKNKILFFEIVLTFNGKIAKTRIIILITRYGLLPYKGRK